MHPISMWISGLDSPHPGSSFEVLDFPFAPFSRSILCTLTLGQIFEPLTISYVYLGYRHLIGKWIPGLDSPHPERSFEPLNIPFAPFPIFIPYTFTSGRTFEPLSISDACLCWRYEIAKRIPGLDSPYRQHSFAPLNIPFAPFLGLLASIFHVLVLVVT